MIKISSDAVEVIDEVLKELGSFDFIINDAAKKKSEPGAYILAHRHEYIRTVSDILARCDRGSNLRILEIGAFFGVVCIAMARLGYSVTAADIAEYMDMPEQVDRFGRYGVIRASIKAPRLPTAV
jgi:predicted O-methyltransferase YrrM